MLPRTLLWNSALDSIKAVASSLLREDHGRFDHSLEEPLQSALTAPQNAGYHAAPGPALIPLNMLVRCDPHRGCRAHHALKMSL